MVLHRRAVPLFLALGLFGPHSSFRAQAVAEQDRGRAHSMLEQVRKDLRRYYYDSTFGGIDLDARYRVADSALDQATTVQQVLGVVAQFVMDLKDSHTNFIPQARAAIVEYGWRWVIIGDSCYVRSVRKGSDAEKKGLTIGDRVIAIDGMLPNRRTIDLIGNLYYSLSPRPGMRVGVQGVDGTVRQVDILAKITPTQRVFDYNNFTDVGRIIDEIESSATARRHWWRSFGDSVLVWHFLGFQYLDEGIDEMMNMASRHKTLILDLRNNGGGAELTIQRLIGHFYDHEVRIGTIHERNKTSALVARPAGRKPFTGNLIILINRNSASASEITTRFFQLDGRATVVGDRSMGAVMGARYFPHETGFSKFIEWGLQITGQDILMPDEGRLENVGVTPEFIILPTGADLANHRDPQMAKALQLAGIQMDPTEAAKIYPTRPEGDDR